MTKIERYIERRVRELLAERKSDRDIIQQLEAVHGRKIVLDTLHAAVKSEKV